MRPFATNPSERHELTHNRVQVVVKYGCRGISVQIPEKNVLVDIIESFEHTNVVTTAEIWLALNIQGKVVQQVHLRVPLVARTVCDAYQF